MFLNDIGQHSAAPAFSRHSIKILEKIHPIKHSDNDLKFHLAGGKPVKYLTNQGVEFGTARKQCQLAIP